MNRSRIIAVTVALAASAAVVAGCSTTPDAAAKDQAKSNNQLDVLQRSQPIPFSTWSQYRQTLTDVELAQIHGVATTSFFFNQGAPVPYKSCPSIGFPVASTSQLTNPEQSVTHGESGIATIGQLEPNGTFTGQSTGTYVVCVAANGIKYISYAEGFVHTEGGPAHWDGEQRLIVDDGAPTVTTATK